MFRDLMHLFETLLSPSSAAAGDEPARVQLATAVLLVEVMRADAHTGTAERQAVIEALRTTFALADDALAHLVAMAEQTARDATDFFSFTEALNAHFDEAQKLAVVESMWHVAYADGQLAAYEQHVLWRVADLLHVPHGAYINAKMRAKAAAGLD